MGAIYECLTGRVQCISNNKTTYPSIKVGDEFDITDGRIEGVKHDYFFYDIDEVNDYFAPYGIQFKVTEKFDI